MTRIRSTIRPVTAGLCVALAQIALAVFLFAPEGALSERYSSLLQHDSFWFRNIVERGYNTTVPPIDHKSMEVSNVAFFPGYPMLAGVAQKVFHLDTGYALLITAQTAAWGFWSYFFLFCERWGLSPALQLFGTLAVVAHPAAFFLIAGYSESLFLMMLAGFAYWSTAEGRAAKFWAILHGIGMSATRIVGLPCAAFPVVCSVFKKGWAALRSPVGWVRQYGLAVVFTALATLGGVLFFAYCLLRWGRWDLYMLTQNAGWGIVPDYLAPLKLSSYRWLIPALDDPIEVSQLSVTLGALLFIAIAACEFLPSIRRRANWPTRAGIYFCAGLTFYLAVSGVACAAMQSMLRYEFCAHALLVLAFLNYLGQVRISRIFARATAMVVVAFACAASLSLQGWYVWNFTRGNWVA